VQKITRICLAICYVSICVGDTHRELSSFAGASDSLINLPGTINTKDTLTKFEHFVTAPETQQAFKRIAQECPLAVDICARNAYLAQSIIAHLDDSLRKKFHKYTQSLICASICCINHLHQMQEETEQWSVDVSMSSEKYVVKFPRLMDIGYKTTPERNFEALICAYPQILLDDVRRIVEHPPCNCGAQVGAVQDNQGCQSCILL
jgi:hypothetical protein